MKKSSAPVGSLDAPEPLEAGWGPPRNVMRALRSSHRRPRAAGGREDLRRARQEDPFQVLIATLLSARTQDATTLAASTRLFKAARTPRTMAKLTVKQIERLIYPVSFYRHKARHVKATCRILVERFGGRVPTTMEELLLLPGVGRKTANLVLILAFKSVKNICVDTHVHRISNRLGWVRTRTPDETEQALYKATDAAMVAAHQSVSRDVGPERVPAGVPALRRVCDSTILSAGRRDADLETGKAFVRGETRRVGGLAAVVLAGALSGLMATSVAAQAAWAPSSSSRRRRGRFPVETYPNEAPRTVAHIVELVRKGFYDGQRFHRAVQEFLIQWGDPRSRDTSRRADWGKGDLASSGKPIGAAEVTKKRMHTRGAVAVASPTGHPQLADSQMYVALARRPDLDGHYTVFGHIIAGEDVPGRIEAGDVIRRMYVQ